MKNIILFSHPRSGSSKVVYTYIGANSNVDRQFKYESELLNIPNIKKLWNEDYIKYNLWAKKYSLSNDILSNQNFDKNSELVKTILEDMLSENLGYMFKYFSYMQNVMSVTEITDLKKRHPDLLFVSLERTNKFDTFMSTIIARCTDIWHIGEEQHHRQNTNDPDLTEYRNKISKIQIDVSIAQSLFDKDNPSSLITMYKFMKDIKPYMDIQLTYEEDVLTNEFATKLNILNKEIDRSKWLPSKLIDTSVSKEFSKNNKTLVDYFDQHSHLIP